MRKRRIASGRSTIREAMLLGVTIGLLALLAAVPTHAEQREAFSAESSVKVSTVRFVGVQGRVLDMRRGPGDHIRNGRRIDSTTTYLTVFARTEGRRGQYKGTLYVKILDDNDREREDDSIVDMSSLGESDGFKIDGIPLARDEEFGDELAVGDVNGDGLNDIILGVPQDKRGMGEGAVYVVFGKSDGWPQTLRLDSLNGINGVRIVGGAEFGNAVATGDVNGDDICDLVIGDPGKGVVEVVLGTRAHWPALLRSSELDEAEGFSIVSAEEGSRFGSPLAVGDVNGDGIIDIVAGAAPPYTDRGVHTTAYILFGRPSWPSRLDLSKLDSANGLRLSRSVDSISETKSSAVKIGDINHDGIQDIVVGAGDWQKSYGNKWGRICVIFGREGGWPTMMSLDHLDGITGTRVVEGEVDVWSGGFGVGLINGDATDDLVVFNSNSAYAVFGRAESVWPRTVDASLMNGTNGFSMIDTRGVYDFRKVVVLDKGEVALISVPDDSVQSPGAAVFLINVTDMDPPEWPATVFPTPINIP